MAVPKDQGLVITIFMSISIFVILLAWIFLPPTISFEDDEDRIIRILPPDEAVLTAEEILTQAEQSLSKLEEDKEGEAGKEGKDKK